MLHVIRIAPSSALGTGCVRTRLAPPLLANLGYLVGSISITLAGIYCSTMR